MVDYSHSSEEALFVQHNADCLGVYEKLATRFHTSLTTDDNKFILPFASGSFDRIIVSPNFRNSVVIGSMFTSEDDKVPRMMSVLTEGMRVLREGGELCAYEDGNTSVRMWADLRDAGFSATVTDAQRTATPVMKKSTKMFHLVCPFSRPVVATEHVALHMTTDNAVSGDTIPKVDIGPTIRLVIVSTIQLILFVVLVLILLPLYKPLSIPTSIPFDTRLGNVVAAIIMGYPMFAHVSRAHFVASLHVICSVGDALSLSIKSELVTLGIASAFHAVNQLPGFLIQVAANGVSMSSSVASTLGVIVSFALGAAVVRYVEHMLRARLIASRNIPQEYAKLL